MGDEDCLHRFGVTVPRGLLERESSVPVEHGRTSPLPFHWPDR